MAIEKIINIKVDAKDAVKGVDSITGALEGVEKQADDAGDSVEGVGKSAEKSKKGFKSMATGIKGVGTALKAAGIGLVIALVAGLTEAFSRNKRIMDALGIVMGTIGEVFSQITTAIIDTYDAVATSTDNFDALGKVLSGLLTLAITPLKLAFFGIVLAVQSAQLAWEQSFFGGKDADKIAELNESILQTKLNIGEVAVDALKAGQDIVTNFGEAITEVGNIGTIAIENLSKVSISTAKATATANQQAIQSAIIAEATASRLVAQFERQAEIQRQIRDDDAKSITERQAANTKLNEILAEQEKQLLAQADAVIAGAKAELQKNDSIENQAALISAVAGKEQVLADIEGKRSEQLANKVALLREEKDLITTVTDAENERAKAQAEFDAEQIEDPEEKLQAQRDALDAENELILEDLERKKELFALGTQARVDAEEDFKNKKQVIDNQIVANEKAIDKVKTKQAEDISAAKVQLASATLNLIGQLVDRDSIAGKGIALAQVGIDTALGISKAISTNPPPSPLGVLGAAIVGVSGIAQTIAITNKKIPSATGKGFVGGGAGGGAQPKAPSFNLVEGTGTNQISESIEGQDSVTRAIVVSSDVTTAQSADRNIIESSSL